MYSFSYQGELVEGADQGKVIEKLALLFSITETEAAQLFEVDKEFFRDGLEQSTAQDYLALFGRIGARGYVRKSTPSDSISKSSEKNSKADSVSALSNEQQGKLSPLASGAEFSHVAAAGLQSSSEEALAFGAHQKALGTVDNQVEYGADVMKHLEAKGASATQQQRVEPLASDSTADKSGAKRPQLQRNKKSTAARWLGIGGMAVVGTMIADEQLQSALIVDRHGLDFGYWPLLIAHIPLVIGCYFLAQEKRLSAIFKCFGLLSFAGLSVLLLLPAKGQKDHKIGLGPLAMTLFSCCLFVYWFGGAMQSTAETQSLNDRLIALRDGRTEFPATEHQGSLDLYRSEQSELHQTMIDIIALVNSEELRPNQVTELSNAMMSEVSRYITWRQYQQFLHNSNGKTLPEGLDAKFQEGDESKIGGVLRSVTQESNKRLYESVTSWTVTPLNNDQQASTSGVRRQLDRIFDALQEAWMLQMESDRRSNADAELSSMPPKIDIAMLALPELNGAELLKHDNHVEYQFNSGPLNGKTLAVGFYTVKRPSKWQRKVSYAPQYKLLNSDVSTIYISNLLSGFGRYVNPTF